MKNFLGGIKKAELSSKYQIEAYNKLDAYAAMAIFFKRHLPYVLLFEPYEIIKDNWFRDEKKFLELFGEKVSLNEYLNAHHDKVKEAYLTIKEI